MKYQKVFEQLHSARLISILRGDFLDRHQEIVQVLLDAGVSAIEVSIVSRDAYRILRELVGAFSDRMAIGAGTVVTQEQVKAVSDCGVSFVISPVVNADVIDATLAQGLISIPGAYTPSEIYHATELGCHAVKVFPASTLGPSFVRAMLGPFPDLRLIPTGGVGLKEVASYLKAGAWAVAAGTELVHDGCLKDGGLNGLRERATRFIAEVQSGSSER